MIVLGSPADLSPGSLTILDVVLLLALLYSCARGFFQGLVSELGLFLALIAGTALASRFAAEAGAPLAILGIGESQRAAGGYALVLILVWAAVRILTGVLHGGTRVLMLGWVDHLAGAAFGLLRGLLIVIVVSFVIVHFRVGALGDVAHVSPLARLVSPIFPALDALLPQRLQPGPISP